MMKKKIISSKETAESPTLCMSPLRYLKECHKCEKFKAKKLKDALKMKCQPRVKPEVIELLRRKEKLLKKLREIDKKLEEV